ncbi:MAG: hypothetical protein WCS37_02925 [Chloroflexota bacterium]
MLNSVKIKRTKFALTRRHFLKLGGITLIGGVITPSISGCGTDSADPSADRTLTTSVGTPSLSTYTANHNTSITTKVNTPDIPANSNNSADRASTLGESYMGDDFYVGG